MYKKGITYSLLLIVSFYFYSCMQVATEVKSWIDVESVEEVIGEFHHLENDGIKVYLPQAFEKISSVEYQQILDSLVTEKEFNYESKRLKSLREMEGNFYIFFDEFSRSTYTINTMPYMPLYKRDAQYLLGMIRLNNEKVAENTDFEFTKVTSTYNSNATTQVFKVIYRIEDPKRLKLVINTTYILSSNKKTLFINLSTPYDVNFDPFLQKMIL